MSTELVIALITFSLSMVLALSIVYRALCELFERPQVPPSDLSKCELVADYGDMKVYRY